MTFKQKQTKKRTIRQGGKEKRRKDKPHPHEINGEQNATYHVCMFENSTQHVMLLSEATAAHRTHERFFALVYHVCTCVCVCVLQRKAMEKAKG
jgi:hypothetical protein